MRERSPYFARVYVERGGQTYVLNSHIDNFRFRHWKTYVPDEYDIVASDDPGNPDDPVLDPEPYMARRANGVAQPFERAGSDGAAVPAHGGMDAYASSAPAAPLI